MTYRGQGAPIGRHLEGRGGERGKQGTGCNAGDDVAPGGVPPRVAKVAHIPGQRSGGEGEEGCEEEERGGPGLAHAAHRGCAQGEGDRGEEGCVRERVWPPGGTAR